MVDMNFINLPRCLDTRQAKLCTHKKGDSFGCVHNFKVGAARTHIALPCHVPHEPAAAGAPRARDPPQCPARVPRDDDAHKGPAQVVRQVSLVSTVRYQGELSRLWDPQNRAPLHPPPPTQNRIFGWLITPPSEGSGLITGQYTYTGHISFLY